jgi:alcohol dehydrogenase class IV
MSTFTIIPSPRLVVGWGTAISGGLASEAAANGKRPLIVTGNALERSGALADIVLSLQNAGLAPVVHKGVPPEPDLVATQQAIDKATAENCDSIIAIGGGSALDVGKCAVLSGDIRDYFSGKVPVPETSPRKILAVPTTAGTGSEATWVSVLVDKASNKKTSIRGGALMPATALLDASLTLSCPPTVTAHSGMDALVQALESYTSRGANPYTQALAGESLRMIASSLHAAYVDPDNQEAREQMLLGSYMAGIALNTSRLGLVHGLAHPIGAITGLPHGLLCAVLLPSVMKFNQCGAYADLLGGTSVRDAIMVIEESMTHLKIPRKLSQIRVGTANNRSGLEALEEEQIAQIIADAMVSGSTKANPRPVTEDDIRAVLMDCF